VLFPSNHPLEIVLTSNPVHSVVFASAYRFSVLFTYTADDPTYTLAPTVGWTAIEMSAAIVSACLPTLSPVMTFFFRSIGINRSILGTSRGGGGATGATSSRNLGKSTTPSLSDPLDVELQKSRRDAAGEGAFYRLPDEQLSGDTARAVDAELRPEHGYGFTVTSRPGGGKGDGASLSGDEVPLHGIRVQTQFKQSEN
jgi:hypothetical protein